MTHYWHYLQAGDRVDVVAPGYGCPPEMLLGAKTFLESVGLVAHIPENLIGDHPFCSNEDAARLQHVADALHNPDSKAIWCIRGGYGSARIIPGLENLARPEYTKLLIGFSDITALHIWFQQRLGWPTLHAGILAHFCGKTLEDSVVQAIMGVLKGTVKEQLFSALQPLNAAAKENRVIESEVIGGNLSLIQTSIGTGWQLEGRGKIILLEEVGERGYRIDRMLVHMEQAGLFNGVDAILIGDITGDEEKDGRQLGKVAIQRFAHAATIPVLECQGIGHGVLNQPLMLGTKATLTLGDAPKLLCQTGGRT